MSNLTSKGAAALTEASIPQELEGLTEDELLLRLGRMHIGAGAVPQSGNTLVIRGRVIFAEARARLQPILCRPGTKSTADGLTYASLIAVINNEVAATPSFHLVQGAAAVVAMLIPRQGIALFCAGYPPAAPASSSAQ